MKQIIEKAISSFKQEINRDCDQGTQSIIEVIKVMNHFKGLIKERSVHNLIHLQRLALKMSYQEFKKGEIIYHKGDQGDKFYFVLKGKAGIWQQKGESELNKEQKIKREIIQCGKELEDLTEQAGGIDLDNSIYYESVFVRSIKQKKYKLQSMLKYYRDEEEEILLRESGDQSERYFGLNKQQCKIKRVLFAKQGDCFGELSLHINRFRSNTVVAHSELQVMSISGEDYLEIFDLKLHNISFIYDTLQSAFPNSKIDSLLRLARNFKELTFDYGQFVFNEMENSEHIFLVKSGQLETLKRIRLNEKEDNQNSNSESLNSITNEENGSQTNRIQTNKLNPEEEENTLAKQKPKNLFKPYQKFEYIHLGLIGANQILGHEDLKQNFHSFSCKCISNDTVIFQITKKSFFDAIKFHEDKYFQQQIEERAENKINYLKERSEKISLFKEQVQQKEGLTLLQQNSNKKNKTNYIKEKSSQNKNSLSKPKYLKLSRDSEQLFEALNNMDTETLKKIKNGIRPGLLVKNKIKFQNTIHQNTTNNNQSSAKIETDLHTQNFTYSNLTPSILCSPKQQNRMISSAFQSPDQVLNNISNITNNENNQHNKIQLQQKPIYFNQTCVNSPLNQLTSPQQNLSIKLKKWFVSPTESLNQTNSSILKTAERNISLSNLNINLLNNSEKMNFVSPKNTNPNLINKKQNFQSTPKREINDSSSKQIQFMISNTKQIR